MKSPVLAATALAALIATSAAAQSEDGDGRRIRIGLGAQAVPSYPGADEVRVQPFGSFSMTRTGQTFVYEAPDESFGFSLLGRDGLGIGPALAYQNSRRNRDVGVPIGRVGSTIEAGGFVQYLFGERFRIRAEARKGLGGHDGVIADVSADLIARDGDRYVFSIGPRVGISDGKYQRSFFGVDAGQAARTGLPVYRPKGGVQSVGATTGLFYQFSPQWGLASYARYDRLIDDPAGSSLVGRFGSRDQVAGGLALTYTFSVR